FHAAVPVRASSSRRCSLVTVVSPVRPLASRSLTLTAPGETDDGLLPRNPSSRHATLAARLPRVFFAFLKMPPSGIVDAIGPRREITGATSCSTTRPHRATALYEHRRLCRRARGVLVSVRDCEPAS